MLPFPHRFVDAADYTGADGERLRDPHALRAVLVSSELSGFLLHHLAVEAALEVVQARQPTNMKPRLGDFSSPTSAGWAAWTQAAAYGRRGEQEWERDGGPPRRAGCLATAAVSAS